MPTRAHPWSPSSSISSPGSRSSRATRTPTERRAARMGRLEDKVAIITGAGQGIGLAYAERFLAEGAKVVVAEINEDRAARAMQQLDGLGEVRLVQTDIS